MEVLDYIEYKLLPSNYEQEEKDTDIFLWHFSHDLNKKFLLLSSFQFEENVTFETTEN